MNKSEQVLDRLGRLHPQLIDLSLDRIIKLLEKLGWPQDRLPAVIHVAGTNGKGSVIAFLGAILTAAGLRVHAYTSPHLVSFHERIRTSDDEGVLRAVGEDELVRALEEVERINGGDPMTFFEITTAAALKLFAEIPADVVLLEVGLGGRFDATNVIDDPRLSIITTVSLDHMDKLGNSVALIAREKAGILKPGVACVVAGQDGAAFDVIEAHGEAVGARIIAAGRDFDAFEQGGRMIFQREDTLLDLPLPVLIGRHQIANAGVAVAAALEVDEFGVDERAIERGLLEVSWPARMQRLKSEVILDAAGAGAEVWLDGGHNAAGGQALARVLADLDERSPKPIFLVVGMMINKDVAGFLAPFAGLVRGIVAVPLGEGESASMAPDRIVAAARELGISGEACPDVLAALAQAQQGDGVGRRILICGSLYLAGDVLALETGKRAG